ncbi:MAG: 2-(1,2-epoxy-1,2-dihydrophenyl)acetyl-CoA isomerase [Chitinophagales bacterium]|jgi:2-(1,2-epoxy-1,2-dihydrophenyl)acetyl-CoA isomerase|nr:2-(1,2-epoxy-1,2-dihydrophenyl)acetyl-CoA isomerase [Chitinophagales bacterium]
MSSILVEIKDQVATLTLNRPEKFNAFNREMALLLQQELDACRQNEIRAVVITGNGKAFCAGQDLGEVVDPQGPGMARILKEHYNPIVTRIRELGKPVIAAVNGVAAGAGANLALCADITIAGESANFIQAFSKIGLVPDTGGSFFLPRLIGMQRAAALMMTGDKLSAAEAASMGMIWKTVPDQELLAQAMGLAKQLATMPTTALGLIKQQLNASFTNTIEEQLQLEDRLQQQAAATADFREGVQAFLEKRTARFTGQ